MPHKQFQYEYSIGVSFLEAHQNKVYSPSCPKSGALTEKQNPLFGSMPKQGGDDAKSGKNPPEKQVHTTIQPNYLLPQQPQTNRQKT